MYSNLTTSPAVTWTGDRTGDGIGESDLRYVLQLAATGTYELEFDSDSSGQVDIVDVQAVAHSINNNVFNFGSDVVPRYCCDLGELPAPVLSVVDYTSGTYSFTWNGSNTLVSVELWNQAESTNLQSVVVSATTGATITNSFTGLTENTTYKVRLVILGEPCEFVQFTTLAYTCIPPVLGEITIDYDNPSGI